MSAPEPPASRAADFEVPAGFVESLFGLGGRVARHWGGSGIGAAIAKGLAQGRRSHRRDRHRRRRRRRHGGDDRGPRAARRAPTTAT